MAGENEEVVEVIDNEEVVEERHYSDDETKAMDHGWVPKDQWKGPEDEWVSAKVFNMRGEFFNRIAKDKQTISELKQSVDALVEHNKNLFDAGYKKALNDLKSEKRAALEAGETEAVMRIDDEIEELRENAVKQKQEFEAKVRAQAQATPPVEFEQWHADNQWYQKDGPMTAYANAIGEELAIQTRNAGKSIDWPKFYQEVGRKVRQKFPEKFESRSRSRAGDTVDTGEDRTANKPNNSGSTIKESELSDDERRIMTNILKTTKMTKKEYLEQMSLFDQRKNRR